MIAFRRWKLVPLALSLACSGAGFTLAPADADAQTRTVIRAGRLIDGKGGVRDSVIVVVEGSRIARITSANDSTVGAVTYDLSRFTLLPEIGRASCRER